MELLGVRVDNAREGRVRLVGEVRYDDRVDTTEMYWFDVPERYAGDFSATGNPWLVCLAPLAATLGQTLRLSLPVDRLLCRNVREVLAIWRSWYPELHPIEVTGETIDGLPEVPGERTASTFSGGVDSFFTAVRSTEPGALAVDDLITIAGFDIPLSNLSAFERRRSRLAEAASELGKTLVDVVTNLRQTRLKQVDWATLWHGAGLASVGLALEGRYRRMLIASTHPYFDVLPLGSHPLTDPLFSTSRTEILHDGAAYTRAEKTEYLSKSAIALRNLHVCYRAASDRNCGACEKCLRTMATLDVLGKLPAAETFSADRVDPRRLARVLVLERQEGHYRAIRSLAAARERFEIVRVVRRALRRSRWRRRVLWMPKWLAKRRGLWRLAGPIRRALLAKELV